MICNSYFTYIGVAILLYKIHVHIIMEDAVVPLKY